MSSRRKSFIVNARSSRKAKIAEKPHETAILSKDKMVAGVGFEPTTFRL